VLRLFVGESAARHEDASHDEDILVLEANLDDMSPQVYGYFAERALEAGALDVFSVPVQMKKNRPGLLVTILCEPAKTTQLTGLLFKETTTIGVRIHEAQRRTLAREFLNVETRFGSVRMKLSRLNGSVLNATPEFDDCRRIAAEKGIPLKDVLAAATFAFQKQHEPHK